MSYVKKTLGRNEKILKIAKFHWTEKLIALGALLLLGVIVIGVVIFLQMVLRMATTEIAVTNERFVYKTGWISRKTQEVSLARIEEIKLTQGVVGRLLNYGQISIHGTGVGKIDLPTLDSPLELRRAIINARDTYTETREG